VTATRHTGGDTTIGRLDTTSVAALAAGTSSPAANDGSGVIPAHTGGPGHPSTRRTRP
jgi:hypothetical protein